MAARIASLSDAAQVRLALGGFVLTVAALTLAMRIIVGA
jgi:hypothetical protein